MNEMNLTHMHSRSENSETSFFDDFASGELDRSIWNVEITGNVGNNELQAYVDSPETIYFRQNDLDTTHGILVIQPRYHAGYVTPQRETFDFISGRITTRRKMEFIYGEVFARIMLPTGTGLWPAFWALGSSGPWPQNGEIDIMENVGEPDWTSVAVHGPGYSGETPLVNKKFFNTVNGATSWHIYSAACSLADGLIFKIDGELIYRVTRQMIDYYGAWVFDSPKYLVLNFALGGNYPFKTNGIRSPYYGLSEETVRSIRNNEIKMLVDWVKVSRI
jgi:beta-glucanase (GH16 family)